MVVHRGQNKAVGLPRSPALSPRDYSSCDKHLLIIWEVDWKHRADTMIPLCCSRQIWWASLPRSHGPKHGFVFVKSHVGCLLWKLKWYVIVLAAPPPSPSSVCVHLITLLVWSVCSDILFRSSSNMLLCIMAQHLHPGFICSEAIVSYFNIFYILLFLYYVYS